MKHCLHSLWPQYKCNKSSSSQHIGHSSFSPTFAVIVESNVGNDSVPRCKSIFSSVSFGEFEINSLILASS